MGGLMGSLLGAPKHQFRRIFVLLNKQPGLFAAAINPGPEAIATLWLALRPQTVALQIVADQDSLLSF